MSRCCKAMKPFFWGEAGFAPLSAAGGVPEGEGAAPPLPAGLIYTPFPMDLLPASLPPAHTPNSWDAPLSVDIISPHSSWGGSECLSRPPLALGSCPSASPGCRSRTRVSPSPAVPVPAPRAQGAGSAGALRTFTDFPDFRPLFRLPQQVPLCRCHHPGGDVSRELERGTGGTGRRWGRGPWGQAGSACPAPCERLTRGTTSSAAGPVTRLGKAMGPCGLAGWGARRGASCELGGMRNGTPHQPLAPELLQGLGTRWGGRGQGWGLGGRCGAWGLGDEKQVRPRTSFPREWRARPVPSGFVKFRIFLLSSRILGQSFVCALL